MGLTEEPEYDSVTCITAAELREMGFPVPKDVPDCGWVPILSIKVELAPGAVFDAVRKTVTMNHSVQFTEPFRWVSVKWTVRT